MPIAARRPPRYTPAGIELPRGVDGRTRTSRRFRALISAFEAELGGNGNLTEADKALCKQAAALSLQAEQLQADIVAGAKVDTDTMIRVSSEARRALSQVAARTKTKPAAGPSIEELFAGGADAE